MKESWACALTIHLERADLQGTDGSLCLFSDHQGQEAVGVAAQSCRALLVGYCAVALKAVIKRGHLHPCACSEKMTDSL